MYRKLIVNGIIPKTKEPAAPVSDFDEYQNLEHVETVLVSNTRSATSRKEIDITSDADIVQLEFEDETTWIGNAHEVHEVFNLTLGRGLEADVIEVPSVLLDRCCMRRERLIQPLDMLSI